MKKQSIIIASVLTALVAILIVRTRNPHQSPLEDINSTEKPPLAAPKTPSKSNGPLPPQAPTNPKELWPTTPQELEAVVFEQKPEMAKSFKLEKLYPTRMGYRASPTIDGREIFGQQSEYRKEGDRIRVYWRELPQLQIPTTNFPKYDKLLFVEKISEFYALRKFCGDPAISDQKEYWYMRDTGELLPTVSFRVRTLCEKPREQREEIWIYSLRDGARLEIISKK